MSPDNSVRVTFRLRNAGALRQVATPVRYPRVIRNRGFRVANDVPRRPSETSPRTSRPFRTRIVKRSARRRPGEDVGEDAECSRRRTRDCELFHRVLSPCSRQTHGEELRGTGFPKKGKRAAGFACPERAHARERPRADTR